MDRKLLRQRAPSPTEGYIARQAKALFEAPALTSQSQMTHRSLFGKDSITGDRFLVAPGNIVTADRGMFRPSHRGPRIDARVQIGEKSLRDQLFRFIDKLKDTPDDEVQHMQIKETDPMKMRILDHEINRRTKTVSHVRSALEDRSMRMMTQGMALMERQRILPAHRPSRFRRPLGKGGPLKTLALLAVPSLIDALTNKD